MNQELGDKFDVLLSELDTAIGMLTVASMKDSTVRSALDKLICVSNQLGEIINEELE